MSSWIVKLSDWIVLRQGSSPIVHDGKLFDIHLTLPGSLIYWDGIASTSTTITTNPVGIDQIIEYNSEIYGTDGGWLFKFNGVDLWEQKAPRYLLAFSLTLCVFNSKIYGCHETGLLLEWNGINAWVEVAPYISTSLDGDPKLIVFNNKLYAAFSGGGAVLQSGRLYEWDGISAWVLKAPKFSVDCYAFSSLCVHNGILYAATVHPYEGVDYASRLLKWNGTNAWELGAENTIIDERGLSLEITSLLSFDSNLFASTYRYLGTSCSLLKLNESLGRWGIDVYYESAWHGYYNLIEFNNKMYVNQDPYSNDLLEYDTTYLNSIHGSIFTHNNKLWSICTKTYLYGGTRLLLLNNLDDTWNQIEGPCGFVELGFNIISPVVFDDVVYFVSPDGYQSNALWSFDEKRFSTQWLDCWRRESTPPSLGGRYAIEYLTILTTPGYGALYGSTKSGHLLGTTVVGGLLNWRILIGTPSGDKGFLASHNGSLYVISWRGELYIYTGITWDYYSSQPVDAITNSKLISSGGKLYMIASSSIVGWWAVEDSLGSSILRDFSGNNNNATIANLSNAEVAAGKVETALNIITPGLDGGYASAAHSSSLQLSSKVSLEAWVYVRSLPIGSADAGIIMKASYGGSYDDHLSYGLVVTTSGFFSFRIGKDDASPYSVIGGTVELNNWIHIVGTYDSVGSILKIYKNKILVGTASYGGTHPIYTTYSYPIYIGAVSTSKEGLISLDGLVDETTVYNTVLTQEQIHYIYEYGPHGKYRNTI